LRRSSAFLGYLGILECTLVIFGLRSGGLSCPDASPQSMQGFLRGPGSWSPNGWRAGVCRSLPDLSLLYMIHWKQILVILNNSEVTFDPKPPLGGTWEASGSHPGVLGSQQGAVPLGSTSTWSHQGPAGRHPGNPLEPPRSPWEALGRRPEAADFIGAGGGNPNAPVTPCSLQ
jgi:hypothetical protein